MWAALGGPGPGARRLARLQADQRSLPPADRDRARGVRRGCRPISGPCRRRTSAAPAAAGLGSGSDCTTGRCSHSRRRVCLVTLACQPTELGAASSCDISPSRSGRSDMAHRRFTSVRRTCHEPLGGPSSAPPPRSPSTVTAAATALLIQLALPPAECERSDRCRLAPGGGSGRTWRPARCGRHRRRLGRAAESNPRHRR